MPESSCALLFAWTGAYNNRRCEWSIRGPTEASKEAVLNPAFPPCHSSPPTSHSRSLSVTLSHSLDLKQNSIAQFHTLSAVDKGRAGCSPAPVRDTARTQNGRKSNSSRQ